MTTNDAARHALYTRLEDILGREHADILMTYLPTERSDEVATKGDVDRLEERFDRLEERLNGLYETIIDQQKFYARSTVWSMVGLTAIFSLVVAFFG